MPKYIDVVPPEHCQYAKGACDQDLSRLVELQGFFLYPKEPRVISQTMAEAVKYLQNHTSEKTYKSWECLNVGGQIIFCEICKAINSSGVAISDITTLNFNVMFELGYALGLGKAVLPVRDTSYVRDGKLFDELGIFDSLGYEDFRNSIDLVKLTSTKPFKFPFKGPLPPINKQAPIFYVKSPFESDGSIKLSASLKRGFWKFRSFDSRETPRLSLHDAYREVVTSIAVVGHLIDPGRLGAQIHNARVAFVCGIAMASQKHVLMLQEGMATQPIDYRDVVAYYTDADMIPRLVENLLNAAQETIQSKSYATAFSPTGLLEAINLGDVAAENEIYALSKYFVKTPQFQQARQGQARLIVGRKGAGKSAIFYGVRNHLRATKHVFVLDLKPEGHQFVKLRELVLEKLSEGKQLHILTAFWNYLLLIELAKRILDRNEERMWQSPESIKNCTNLREVFEANSVNSEDDFSERVMTLVNRIITAFPKLAGTGELQTGDITHTIYAGDIQILKNAILACLNQNEVVWLLFDNIDKGWSAYGARKEDINVLRCLLDATRKLQQSMEKTHVDFKTIVFVRKDIYDLLINQSSDRGKETVANLDWSDLELIKELLLKRFRSEQEIPGNFDEVWSTLFDAHVGGESSFAYIISRTFMRPRDILNFVRKAIQIAVSRDHARVMENDVLAAERAFSEDMMNDLRYEIRDVFPQYPEVLNKFIKHSSSMSKDDVMLILLDAGVDERRIENVLDILLWFSFLGVIHKNEHHYSYQLLYDLPKTKSFMLDSSSLPASVIHPAFRMALNPLDSADSQQKLFS